MKQPGIKGSHPGSPTFLNGVPGTTSTNSLRQHNGCGSYQQTGRHTLLNDVCADVETRHLVQQAQQRITQLWESPQVDLFATSQNNKLPVYVSPIPDPQAWAVDALNTSWENLVAYAYPPTALLPRIVQKLQSQLCRLILIAPGWPTEPWFWDLVEMSLDIPRKLPPLPTLLKQPTTNQFHRQPESLNLHVWYLGVYPLDNKVSQQRWQTELLRLRDNPQGKCTQESGPSLNTGVQRNRWTSGVPL